MTTGRLSLANNRMSLGINEKINLSDRKDFDNMDFSKPDKFLREVFEFLREKMNIDLTQRSDSP